MKTVILTKNESLAASTNLISDIGIDHQRPIILRSIFIHGIESIGVLPLKKHGYLTLGTNVLTFPRPAKLITPVNGLPDTMYLKEGIILDNLEIYINNEFTVSFFWLFAAAQTCTLQWMLQYSYDEVENVVRKPVELKGKY